MIKLDQKAQELRSRLNSDLDEETMADLSEIGLKVSTGYTLADAIREGSTVTTQAYNWGDDESACALTAAVIAARARGYL